MKKMIGLVALLFTICLVPVNADAATTRGVWVSCFDYANAGLQDQTEAGFRTNVKKMYAKIKSYGCNTVYFHVRSYDDAIWPSTTFKLSKYLSAKGTLPYDALSILVTEAHKSGLKFHAWMNPYRISATKILDPGKTTTIRRILQAVNEVISTYPVDGIHFDDYFYPSAGNKQYKSFQSLSTTKKQSNVDQMVRQVYSTVKAKRSTLQFGISPAGELSYCKSIGANPANWLSTPGYVDYVVPQIYWSNTYLLSGKKVAFFTRQVAEWKKINKLSKPIYWGLALYRAGMPSSVDLGWKRKSNNIAKQLRELRAGGNDNYVLFSYSNFITPKAKKERINYCKQISTLQVGNPGSKLKAGKKYKFSVKIWPSAIKNKVTYRTSNKKVATVSKKEVIKAKKKGTVKITVALYSKKRTFKIKVKK